MTPTETKTTEDAEKVYNAAGGVITDICCEIETVKSAAVIMGNLPTLKEVKPQGVSLQLL